MARLQQATPAAAAAAATATEVRGILKRASDNSSPEAAAGRGGKRRKVSFQLDAPRHAALIPPPPSSSSGCAAPAANDTEAEATEVATEATPEITEAAEAAAAAGVQEEAIVYEPLRGNAQPVHTLFTGMPNGQKQLWKQAVGMLRVTTVGQLASLPLHRLQATPLTAAAVLRRLQVSAEWSHMSSAKGRSGRRCDLLTSGWRECQCDVGVWGGGREA